jgi:hypothetical protein
MRLLERGLVQMSNDDEPQTSASTDPPGAQPEDLAERRIASRVVDELIRRLVLSLPSDDNDPPRAPPKKTEGAAPRAPLDEPTLRAQARARLRTLRASRAR